MSKDSELSMANLIAKQDYASVIHDPREYQVELFEKAKTKNIIAVLDTGIIYQRPFFFFFFFKIVDVLSVGSGKTLIAVLLLKHVIQQELENRSAGKPHRVSFFLVRIDYIYIYIYMITG